MISHETKLKLFTLAFEYKKTRLWRKLRDTQLFGVELPDGEIAYCSVMGILGQHVSLGVYIGQEGLSSWYDVLREGRYQDNEELSILLGLGQKCLQCTYDDEELTPEAQKEEARAYAQELHASLRAPFKYPQFNAFTPMERCRPIEEEEQAEILIRCLRGAIFVANTISSKSKARIPLTLWDVGSPGVSITVLKEDGDGKFSTFFMPTPDYVRPTIPAPDPLDEFTLRRLQRCHNAGMWDCVLLYFNGEVAQDPYDIPRSPFAIACDTGEVIPAFEIGDKTVTISQLYDGFVDKMIRADIKPEIIRVHECDMRGQAFFGVLADQLKIPMEIKDDLPELNEAVIRFNEINTDPGSDSMQELLSFLVTLLQQRSMEELRELPYEIQILFLSMFGDEDLPGVTPGQREKAMDLLHYWGLL